jgi:hypothetical protein
VTPPEADSLPNSDGLSEDTAHRLLARAVELDAQRLEQVSVEELREIAREAGISARAFEDALAELRNRAAPRARIRAVAANVLPIIGFWGMLRVIDRIGLAYLPNPLVMLATDIGITLAASAVAFRVRGRWAALALSGLAAAQLAAYPIFYLKLAVHIGSPPAWAALGAAGLLGVAFGSLITTRLRPNTNRNAPGRDDAQLNPTANSARVASPSTQGTSLRLRHA